MKRILIIEDDPAISEGLAASLRDAHYEVLTESDGEKGYQRAKRELPDLILLDLMLPSKNGEEICADLRRDGMSTPILMLTSKGEEMDKVLGLELGADDYVTKPFSLRELQARIKAMLRRTPEIQLPDEITVGDLWINFKNQEIMKNSEKVEMSAREFDILKYFVSHRNEVVTRDMLLDEVWGYEHFPTTRTVDNYILSIRKKIETNPAKPVYLQTVHTAGYRFSG